jgi:hypothetical protein
MSSRVKLMLNQYDPKPGSIVMTALKQGIDDKVLIPNHYDWDYK